MQNQRTGIAGINPLLLILGAVVLLCVCGVILLTGGLGNLFGGNPPSAISPGVNPNPNLTSAPANASGANIARIVTARSLGAQNVPQDVTSSFSTNDPIIYVVAEGKPVTAGTSLFARWSRGGNPFEDTPAITADRAYDDTWIEFHIQPKNTPLSPGNYTVQLFINGNPGPQAAFTVQ